MVMVINLTNQTQFLEYKGDQFTIGKRNPLWFNSVHTAPIRDINRIKKEKLVFSLNNIWYAFLFHDHTAFNEDAEKFLVPHITLRHRSLAFFEFAEDETKDYILEQLKQKIH